MGVVGLMIVTCKIMKRAQKLLLVRMGLRSTRFALHAYMVGISGEAKRWAWHWYCCKGMASTLSLWVTENSSLLVHCLLHRFVLLCGLKVCCAAMLPSFRLHTSSSVRKQPHRFHPIPPCVCDYVGSFLDVALLCCVAFFQWYFVGRRKKEHCEVGLAGVCAQSYGSVKQKCTWSLLHCNLRNACCFWSWWPYHV